MSLYNLTIWIAAWALIGGTPCAGGEGSSDGVAESHGVFGPPLVDWLPTLRSDESWLHVEPVYTAEWLSNTRGGISTNDATQYQALLDLGVTLDLERSPIALPGQVFLLGQTTHGRGLTEDFVGDSKVLSNIDSFDNVTQVGEYWWELDAFDGDAIFRIGKQDVNTEFIYIDVAARFLQSSFGLTPSATLPTYPAPAMAAVAKVRFDDHWQLKLGLFDVLADIGSWGLSGNDTILAIAEVERAYELNGLTGRLTGTASYESSGQVDGEAFGEIRGYAIQIEQQIHRSSSCERAEEVWVFAAYYPDFLEAPVLGDSIGDSVVAGVVARGFLPRREHDEIGIGLAWSELFQGGTNREAVVEAYYHFALREGLSLQPDMQYIASPSGIHPDALVVGVRVQVGF